MPRLRAALVALTGLFGSCVALTKPIIWIIDRLSEVDFLATYGGEFGRFLDTGFGTLASVVVGCAIIGFSIFKGLQAPTPAGKKRFVAPAPSASASIAATRSSVVADKADRKTIFIPRMDTTHAKLLTDEADLLKMANSQDKVIMHIATKLNTETQAYVQELVSILEGVNIRTPALSPSAELELLGHIRKLIVLLKGNDVMVYVTDHWKCLPERWEEPETPDPYAVEAQLILVFGPPPEWGENTIAVPVDNGQPRTLPDAPIYPLT